MSLREQTDQTPIFPCRLLAGIRFEPTASANIAAAGYQQELGLKMQESPPDGPFLFAFRDPASPGGSTFSHVFSYFFNVTSMRDDWNSFRTDVLRHSRSFCERCSPFIPQSLSLNESLAIPLFPRADNVLPLGQLLTINLQGPAEVTGHAITGMKWTTSYVVGPGAGTLRVIVESRPPNDSGIELLIVEFKRIVPMQPSLAELETCLDGAHDMILKTRDAILTSEARDLLESLRAPRFPGLFELSDDDE